MSLNVKETTYLHDEHIGLPSVWEVEEKEESPNVSFGLRPSFPGGRGGKESWRQSPGRPEGWDRHQTTNVSLPSSSCRRVDGSDLTFARFHVPTTLRLFSFSLWLKLYYLRNRNVQILKCRHEVSFDFWIRPLFTVCDIFFSVVSEFVSYTGRISV